MGEFANDFMPVYLPANTPLDPVRTLPLDPDDRGVSPRFGLSPQSSPSHASPSNRGAFLSDGKSRPTKPNQPASTLAASPHVDLDRLLAAAALLQVQELSLPRRQPT